MWCGRSACWRCGWGSLVGALPVGNETFTISGAFRFLVPAGFTYVMANVFAVFVLEYCVIAGAVFKRLFASVAQVIAGLNVPVVQKVFFPTPR